jgi:nucleotide-binding universal stress UspA family protein
MDFHFSDDLQINNMPVCCRLLLIFYEQVSGDGMYSKMLVPLDGSEVSERALAHAQSIANAFGARVYLLQVISLTHEYEASRDGGGESPSVVEYSLDLARELTAGRQTRAEKYLEAAAARLESNGIHVETSVRQGLTLENITHFVEENGIDLIVMSTHGRGYVQRFVVGSVTDRVIRSSHVPVLAIPPED